MPFISPDGRTWYTGTEAAKAWGVSRRCVFVWRKAGKLVVKETVGGKPMIWSESIWQKADRATVPTVAKVPANDTCGDCRRKGGVILYCAKHQPELVPT